MSSRLLIISLAYVLSIASANAAMVDASFTATVTEVSIGGLGNPDPAHPLLGTVGTGSFSYDTNDVALIGGTTLLPPSFTLSFIIFGQAFDQSDDSDFPSAPELIFTDGTPTAFDFVLAEPPAPGPNFVSIDEPGIIAIRMGNSSGFGLLTEIGPNSFTTTAGLIATPIPGTLPLLFSALAGAGISARTARRKFSNAVCEKPKPVA